VHDYQAAPSLTHHQQLPELQGPVAIDVQQVQVGLHPTHLCYPQLGHQLLEEPAGYVRRNGGNKRDLP
jgi:hypothetical protein